MHNVITPPIIEEIFYKAIEAGLTKEVLTTEKSNDTTRWLPNMRRLVELSLDHGIRGFSNEVYLSLRPQFVIPHAGKFIYVGRHAIPTRLPHFSWRALSKLIDDHTEPQIRLIMDCLILFEGKIISEQIPPRPLTSCDDMLQYMDKLSERDHEKTDIIQPEDKQRSP